MATYLVTPFPFSGAATTTGQPFDGFTQYGPLGNTYRCLKRNGSGSVVSDNAVDEAVVTYAHQPESDLTHIVVIKFTMTDIDSDASTTQYGVCQRQTSILATGNLTYEGYQTIVSKGTGANWLRIYFGNAQLATITATMSFGSTYYLAQKVTPSGGSTVVTAWLFDSTFNINDFDANLVASPTGPMLATTTYTGSQSNLQALGGYGLLNNGKYGTPTTWGVTDLWELTVVADTAGPRLIGGTLAPDGKTINLEFVEQTLPIVASGGVSGVTIEKRNGFSGSWTPVTLTGAGVIHDSRFVTFTASTPIPAGWDLRATYAAASGNLYDSAGTPNEASDETEYLANFSRWLATPRTWDRDTVLGTYGCLLVRGLAGTTGYEAQSTWPIMLPGGCGTDGFKVYYEGFQDVGLVVKIVAAGVRIVEPDGTVTTATLSFGGSGTTTINQYAVTYATVAGARAPGTIVYVTTRYQENAGGLLPYQRTTPLTELHAGSYDGFAADSGLIGTLTSKILAGGTSGGPSHTASGQIIDATAQNLARTYGPCFVVGKPHENFDGTDDAVLGLGNSLMGDTNNVVDGPLGRAYGDHGDLQNVMPFVVGGVGGGLAPTALSYLAASDAWDTLYGASTATKLITKIIEWYGANDLRVSGRDGGSPFGPEELPARLWAHRESFAALSLARDITHVIGTLTSIHSDSGYMTWPAADKVDVQRARAVYNDNVRRRWDAIPGCHASIDFAAGSGITYDGSWSDDIGSLGNDYQEFDYGSSDGIHGWAGADAIWGFQIREAFKLLDAAASSGSTTVGDGTMTIEKTITMSVTDDWAEVVDTADGSSISGRQFYIGLASETDSVFLRTGTSLPGESDPGRLVNIYNNKVDEVGASSKLYIKSSRTMTALPIELGPAA